VNQTFQKFTNPEGNEKEDAKQPFVETSTQVPGNTCKGVATAPQTSHRLRLGHGFGCKGKNQRGNDDRPRTYQMTKDRASDSSGAKGGIKLKYETCRERTGNLRSRTEKRKKDKKT